MISPKSFKPTCVGLELKTAERLEEIAIHKAELITPLAEASNANQRKKEFSTQSNIDNLAYNVRYYCQSSNYFKTTQDDLHLKLQKISVNFHKCKEAEKNRIVIALKNVLKKESSPLTSLGALFGMSPKGKRISEMKQLFLEEKVFTQAAKSSEPVQEPATPEAEPPANLMVSGPALV